MSTYIIPIAPRTLDLIAVLNNDQRVDCEPETFFLFHIDRPSEIVTREQIEAMTEIWAPIFKIMHLKD